MDLSRSANWPLAPEPVNLLGVVHVDTSKGRRTGLETGQIQTVTGHEAILTVRRKVAVDGRIAGDMVALLSVASSWRDIGVAALDGSRPDGVLLLRHY